ncbi:MFS transporter, UMF1 family [Entomortierella parvispora]|uniref:Autophagy-related protein n=1 Tax=Entomortierella parvispora TaxID=205924 RepID=A0A9P3LWF9_9FUNG|nr:MFS transporter, UMF1 family [Entomortierella parvispora]
MGKNSKIMMDSLSELDLTSYEEKQNLQPPVPPLKNTEVWAWYIQNATYCGFGWVASSLMVPLLIQDMASKAGFEASNITIPCNTTAPHFKCVTPVFGHYLEPGTISLYISSLSSILSFFMSLSISAVADHGSYRKSLMIVMSILGCIVSVCFLLIQKPSLFWLGAILSPLGWTFFNICAVFSHSYLPLYGRAHPEVLDALDRGESMLVVNKIEEQKINDLSAYSVVIANIGSILIHGVCIGISLGMKESALSLELAIAFTGVWWLLWMMIVSPWLEARPGPPLPKGTNWVVHSWRKTYNTMVSFHKLPEIFKFMISWFILSDGISTISSILFLILYRELSFTHSHSLIISVLLGLMASIGAYFFMIIRRIWSLTTRCMILICLGLYGLLMVYLVCTPYFTNKFGLRNAWEGWACTVYIGIIISTFYSSMRCLLSELCPEGDENEWFSLFLLADKGSSWLGPVVTGAIYTATHEYRTAFWFPLGLILLGGLVLLSVDVNKGKDEARTFARDKREKYSLAAM